MTRGRQRAVSRTCRRCMQALRAECPAAFPVRVVRTTNPGTEFGWTNLGSAGFRIVVRERIVEMGDVREATLMEMRDTLVHEWAHVLAWTPEHPSLDDHDAAWAIRYSQAYQAVVGD